jgi:hypothetical protein
VFWISSNHPEFNERRTERLGTRSECTQNHVEPRKSTSNHSEFNALRIQFSRWKPPRILWTEISPLWIPGNSDVLWLCGTLFSPGNTYEGSNSEYYSVNTGSLYNMKAESPRMTSASKKQALRQFPKTPRMVQTATGSKPRILRIASLRTEANTNNALTSCLSV